MILLRHLFIALQHYARNFVHVEADNDNPLFQSLVFHQYPASAFIYLSSLSGSTKSSSSCSSIQRQTFVPMINQMFCNAVRELFACSRSQQLPLLFRSLLCASKTSRCSEIEFGHLLTATTFYGLSASYP